MNRALVSTALLLIAALLGAWGCGGGAKEDPILRLSAAESLDAGKELMEAGKYLKASEYLTHAFEVEPNSPAGREGLLLAAESLYLQGGEDNYIKAEAKYRDFQNRFPTSGRADYVQFQIANALFERMERPDRDQSVTREAAQAYQDLVTLFPTSEYIAEAREKLEQVHDNLAEHEFLVGRFYMRFRLIPAAITRFEYLLEAYPEYSETDKVIYYLGLAYKISDKTEEAREQFERLRSEHPDSEYLGEVPKLPVEPSTPPVAGGRGQER